MDSRTFVHAASKQEIARARALIAEYAASLGCSPCLKHIEDDLKRFPDPFASPEGALILAVQNGSDAGVVGIKHLEKNVAEMARLYVRPRFRGKNLGIGLAEQAMDTARMLGYAKVRLHTLPSMATALGMYRKMGFCEISPYTDDPINGAVYLERTITGNRSGTGCRTAGERS